MTGTAALAPAMAMPTDLLGEMPSGMGARSIAETGQQFESLFLSMILKEMRQTLGDEGLFPGDPGDVQGGLFDLYLGKHMAESGGVGLADALKRLIQPASALHAPEKSNSVAGAVGTLIPS
jgi:peptidoglycan hydrolase FlgJ